MIKDYIVADIFDILLYEETGKNSDITKRDYSALSYRVSSKKTLFKYEGKTAYAGSGDISYVPQNVAYKRNSDGEKLIVFHFRESNKVHGEISVFTPQNHGEYRELFEKALSIWNEKATGYRYKATGVFYDILAKLTNEGMQFSSDADKDISNAIDIIEKNFGDYRFHTSDLASLMYMSETYLRRKFKSALGISPKKYLVNRRISEAKIMLRSGYFTQSEIASKCGFADVKYFRTAFKENTGKTVSRYKSDINS